MGGSSRFSADSGKIVAKSRTILGVSIKVPYPAEQGINSARQGIKVPCSVENRDNSRQMRLAGVPLSQGAKAAGVACARIADNQAAAAAAERDVFT